VALRELIDLWEVKDPLSQAVSWYCHCLYPLIPLLAGLLDFRKSSGKEAYCFHPVGGREGESTSFSVQPTLASSEMLPDKQRLHRPWQTHLQGEFLIWDSYATSYGFLF
jgi:hypothetical protein